MHAMVIDEWGGPETLHEAEVEAPPVSPDFVLIRNHAAGVNPVDTKIREGKLAGAFPSGFPLILGWDAAGTVEKVGPAVHDVPPRRRGVRLLPPPPPAVRHLRRVHRGARRVRRPQAGVAVAGRRPPRSRSPA